MLLKQVIKHEQFCFPGESLQEKFEREGTTLGERGAQMFLTGGGCIKRGGENFRGRFGTHKETMDIVPFRHQVF